MTETRRIAAILVADVVGYSKLMGEDEVGTARAVRERRDPAAPIARGFGGRLVKTMDDVLKGKRKGEWAVSVSGNWRLVFEFEGSNVTNIDLVDYH